MKVVIPVPTPADFWKAVALFAYRRWAAQIKAATNKRPTGIPGNRDPDSPCTAYEPRRWRTGDFDDCETDGHYLCEGCCHRKRHDIVISTESMAG